MGWTPTPEQNKVLSIIPHITGLFSLFGSSCIIIMILRDAKKKLNKPYYRLLFAMSFFDGCSSIAFGLSTWPIPVNTEGVYAPKGNIQTCTAQGFWVQASIASPIYNLMLSVVRVLCTSDVFMIHDDILHKSSAHTMLTFYLLDIVFPTKSKVFMDGRSYRKMCRTCDAYDNNPLRLGYIVHMFIT